MPCVSVVVPVHDAEATIGACVASLLAIDYQNDRFEIICVDNLSTDRSPAILSTFGDAIRVASESRRGAGAARNRGVRESRYDLVAFVDADCTVHSGWLRALVAALRRAPQVAAVGGRILARRPATEIERYGDVIHDHRRAIEECQPPYLIGMNVLVRREALVAAGLFDESMLRGQDVDLAFRLLEGGESFVYADDAVVYHVNERTLGGLFLEGFVHGMWSRRVARAHRRLLGGIPDSRYLARLRSAIRALAEGCVRSLGRGRCAVVPFCEGAFGLGKVLGLMVGSLRFRDRNARGVSEN